MSCTLNKILIFAAGAAIGSLVTMKFMKNKYERMAQEEIDDMQAYYKEKEKVLEEILKDKESAEKEEDNVGEVLKKYNPGVTTTPYTMPAKEAKKIMNEVYVIPPEEFDGCGYELTTLTYYADGTLTDERDEPIDNVEEMIGSDALDSFGEYEEDAVYVRNDTLKTDFEILRDNRNYCDAIPEG